MDTKLFLVCPFSFMEPYIQRTFGSEHCFLTALAINFEFEHPDWGPSVKKVLEDHKVAEIVLVQDLSCKFLTSAVKKQEILIDDEDFELVKILEQHAEDVFLTESVLRQKERLAKRYLKHQLNRISSLPALKEGVSSGNLKIKGLLSDKVGDTYNEIEVELQKRLG